MRKRKKPTHWLENPANIKTLWRIFLGVLALTVVAELFVSLHPVFAIEGLFGFHAAYGYITCVVMILVAKVLSLLIKRPDTYYAEDEADE